MFVVRSGDIGSHGVVGEGFGTSRAYTGNADGLPSQVCGACLNNSTWTRVGYRSPRRRITGSMRGLNNQAVNDAVAPLLTNPAWYSFNCGAAALSFMPFGTNPAEASHLMPTTEKSFLKFDGSIMMPPTRVADDAITMTEYVADGSNRSVPSNPNTVARVAETLRFSQGS